MTLQTISAHYPKEMATTREYIERTRWSITASKLKDFMLCPELYKLKYVDEFVPEEVEDNELKDHWKMGRAFEELLYYGSDRFGEHYNFAEKKYVKEDYARLIAQEDNPNKSKDEIEMIVKWMLKPKVYSVEELQSIWNERHPDERTYLTPAQYRDILGMYKEANRQPLFELQVPGFQNQYFVECQYRTLKLSWTLDRFNEEKKQIRDWKTCGQMDRAERDIQNKFDYITQMAFYYILIYVTHDKLECDVYLDLVGTKTPYNSFPYRVTSNTILHKMQNTLKPAMDKLIQCYETNQRPCETNDMERLRKSPYYPYLETTLATDYAGWE